MSLNVEDIEISDHEPLCVPVREPVTGNSPKATLPSNDKFRDWEDPADDGQDEERPGFLSYEEHNATEGEWGMLGFSIPFNSVQVLLKMIRI